MPASRIRWLLVLLPLVALTAVLAVELLPALTERPRGRTVGVPEENARPGTTGWQSSALKVPAPAARVGSYDPGPIAGYAGATSVDRGQPIDLHVRTTAPSFAIEVYRMGWYGGAGGRLVASVADLPPQIPPVPLPDPSTGLIEADWPVAYTLQTGADWTSGIYLAKLVASTGAAGYAPFVVRDDAAPVDIVYQVPLTTYQAYNNWGGKSLYDYNSDDGRAVEVSFDRPYAQWAGAGSFFDGDFGMVRWLEQRGFDVKYATSLDLHADPRLLDSSKVFLSSWHDEYWSRPMRDRLSAAIGAGKHVAFFSSNNVYWQVRFEPSPRSGRPGRVMVSYQDAARDPLASAEPALTTVRWRDLPVREPENELLGSMWDGQFDWGKSYPWVVVNAGHWIYQGTDLRDGEQIAGLVGYEYDRVFDNGKTPIGVQVLSRSPVATAEGRPSVAEASIYVGRTGGIVFNAGTNYWAWKLDDNDYQRRGADARVQRMTANLLTRMTRTGASAP